MFPSLGGVTPLPLARLAPITLTSSLTETPCSSGGMSLLTGKEDLRASAAAAGDDRRLGEGLPDLAAELSSDLNHFWKNDFRSSVPERLRGGVAGEGLLPATPPPPPIDGKAWRGGVN